MFYQEYYSIFAQNYLWNHPLGQYSNITVN